VLPTGERLAVEAERHDRVERLARPDGTQAGCRSGGSGSAGVGWLTHRPAVRDPRALRTARSSSEEAWAEVLPEAVPVWAD
jgi:hypothetical protein